MKKVSTIRRLSLPLKVQPAINCIILQNAGYESIKTKKWKRFKDTKDITIIRTRNRIGVNGGALCGRAVYSESDIKHFRRVEPETPLILVRPDTVPDDVGVLLQVEGLLTAKGGKHFACRGTIPQLNKVGVVGFSKLKGYEVDEYAQ